MSATHDTIAALNAVADWIDDLSRIDDATAFVHSTALREAAGLIEKQARVIADLRFGKDDGSPRVAGFYWVYSDGKWSPAEWDGRRWWPFGSMSNVGFEDADDIGDIGPRIPFPTTPKPPKVS